MNDSLLRRYIERVVAGRGLFYLLRYELLVSLLKGLPGAAGIALRSIFYKYIFKHIASNAVVEHNVTLRCPNKVVTNDIPQYCVAVG